MSFSPESNRPSAATEQQTPSQEQLTEKYAYTKKMLAQMADGRGNYDLKPGEALVTAEEHIRSLEKLLASELIREDDPAWEAVCEYRSIPKTYQAYLEFVKESTSEDTSLIEWLKRIQSAQKALEAGDKKSVMRFLVETGLRDVDGLNHHDPNRNLRDPWLAIKDLMEL